MTNYDQLIDVLCAEGMDKKASQILAKKLREDENAFIISPEKKKWALENGFLPGRTELYGLTEENIQFYVPDYNYYMLHPINHHFKIWINDKLTLKYVFNTDDLKQYMPEYYVYIENNGSYTYLMDCPKTIEKGNQFLWRLLCEKKKLAIKPNSGVCGGYGFVKLVMNDDGVFENDTLIDKRKLDQISDSINNYIITEYIDQHDDLKAIWPHSECTLRVIMCKDMKSKFEADHWTCAACFARFGTKKSPGVSNLTAGGIGVGFDYNTGMFNREGLMYKKAVSHNMWRLNEHPDSKQKWYGLGVPNWDEAKIGINKICEYISSLSYLGIDIIISQEGMKICEINSLPAMDYVQEICGPVLKNESIKNFFASKGLFADRMNFYDIYTRCQE